MSIGNRIKRVRQDHALSQAEFAQRLGVSLQTVLRMEKNKFLPSAVTLQSLARDFGVHLNWLLVGDGPEQTVAGSSIKIVEGAGENRKVVGQLNIPGVNGSIVFQVKSEEMFPVIRPGDYVVVSSSRDMNDGNLVAYSNQWGEIRVRRYRANDGILIQEHENASPIDIKCVDVIGSVEKIVRVLSPL